MTVTFFKKNKMQGYISQRRIFPFLHQLEFQCCVNDVCGKIVSQPNNDMPLSFVIIKASENPEKSLQVMRLNK